ncbi:hypothetical protein B0H12DRAFT_694637 [Mycena haematopus]|nr:hypothetical protein B0H12DRAFT_694637 [Mycena haematopus]
MYVGASLLDIRAKCLVDPHLKAPVAILASQSHHIPGISARCRRGYFLERGCGLNLTPMPKSPRARERVRHLPTTSATKKKAKMSTDTISKEERSSIEALVLGPQSKCTFGFEGDEGTVGVSALPCPGGPSEPFPFGGEVILIFALPSRGETACALGFVIALVLALGLGDERVGNE